MKHMENFGDDRPRDLPD